MLAFSRLTDVRQVARHYAGQSFPAAFDNVQEAIFNDNQESQKNSLQSRIGKLFSFGKQSVGGSSTGATYRERKLERIEMRRKEYSRIKELMQKQLQAEMEKEKQYYAEHKMALWDLFSKGPPPPPPPSSSSSQ